MKNRATALLYSSLTVLAILLATTKARADIIYAVDSGTIVKLDTNGVSSLFASPNLVNPDAMAYDQAGNLYVANSGSDTIEKFDTNGVGTVFATDPGDNSVLSSPQGLAFDASGNLYAANSGVNTIGNYTIEEFDTNGVGTVFATDPGDGSVLQSPVGLAFDQSGNLYAANSGSASIEEFDTNGAGTPFVTSGLHTPGALAFDAAGNLYVADTGSASIEEISTNAVVSTFATNGLNNPAGLAFDGAGNLYVVNNGTGLTYGNNTVEMFTTNGVGSVFIPYLFSPSALAFNSAGQLLVADYSNIKQYDTLGYYLGIFVTDSLSIPDGLACDSAGNLYVANYFSGSIEKFTSSGAASVFVPPGYLAGPVGLAFDGAGNLYAASTSADVISKIDTNGVVTTFATDPGDQSVLDNPRGLAIDSAGNVFVVNHNVNTNNAAIEKFTTNGTGSMFALTGGNPSFASYIAADKARYIYAFNPYFNALDKFSPDGSHVIFANNDGTNLSDPQGMAFDSAGYLYVANQYSDTIVRFGTNGVGSVFAGSANGLISPSAIAIWPGLSAAAQPVPPVLKIISSGTNALLSWPVAVGTNYSLQSLLALNNTNWAAVTNIPVTIGTNYVVTNGTAGVAKFYRLIGH